MSNLQHAVALLTANPSNAVAFVPRFQSAGIVTFDDAKGKSHQLTAEGALMKGGRALSALKDLGLESALVKAAQGKYRAASDVLCVAFPSVGKAAEKLIGTPWANKATMATLINACRNAEEPEKGWNKRQISARMLLNALCHLPAFKDCAPVLTIDADEEDTPAAE